MPRNILSDKRLIALSAEFAAERENGISLVRKSPVGASYPYRPEVPGIWVYGPDQSGFYTVSMNILVAGASIPNAVGKLRMAIKSELSSRNLADQVRAIDINVKDWAKVA